MKLWKRVCNEASIEIVLLEENWKYILGGLIFQVCSSCLVLMLYHRINLCFLTEMASDTALVREKFSCGIKNWIVNMFSTDYEKYDLLIFEI